MRTEVFIPLQVQKAWEMVVANLIYELPDPGLEMPEGIAGDEAKAWLCRYLAEKAVGAIVRHEQVVGDLARLRVARLAETEKGPLRAIEVPDVPV